MKFFKKGRKFFYAVNIILIVVLCAVTIHACLDPMDYERVFEDFVDARFFSVQRGVIFLVALLILVFEAFFIMSLLRKEEKPVETVNLTTPTGQISITAYSLETMVKSIVSRFDSVADVRTKVDFSNSQVGMDISVKVKSSVLIPEISSKIQSIVKEEVLKSTGIELHSIRVFVDGIN